MARTDRFTKFAMILLFITLAAYIGTYVVLALDDDMQTAAAVETTLRDYMPVSGIIVRSESVITNDRPYTSVTAGEGTRVSAGGTIAIAYGTELALARADRIRELQNEISRMDAALTDASEGSYDPSTREKSISSAITSLTAAVARHDLGELDRHIIGIKSLVFTESGYSGEAGLRELQDELESLYVSASTDTMPIRAPRSGLFSTIVDGYEHIEPQTLAELSPRLLEQLISSEGAKPANAIGKLIDGVNWYFAASVPADFAEKLEPGTGVRLEFSRYYNSALTVRVESIGPQTDGECVLVLSCAEAMADTLAMRLASAEIVISSQTGIRVPKKALYVDENGTAYVYTMTGLQAERKDVVVITETEDYFLVERGSKPSALREGNDIIMTSRELFDGMVLG